MHDAHGILHDARCMMRMALPVHQFARPAHSQHPFDITNENAQMKFGFYPREGRYPVFFTTKICSLCAPLAGPFNENPGHC